MTAFTYRCSVHGDVMATAAQAQGAVAGVGAVIRQTIPCPSAYGMDGCDRLAFLQPARVLPGCGDTPLPGGGYPTMPMRPAMAHAVHVVALARVIEVAGAFVRAHCELETLAARAGVEAACASSTNERVLALHLELERAVLGDEAVPGRRSR